MQTRLEQTWAAIDHHLRQAVDASTYEIWLEPLRLHAQTPEALVVAAPDRIERWVSKRFGNVLAVAAEAVIGGDVGVDIVPESRAGHMTSPSRAHPGEDVARPDSFNPKLTFAQFVIGADNHLAHAAALAVAELPGQAYNPLFICGPPGVGKTHLLHSIANYLHSHASDLTVRYTTVEAFTTDFVEAARSQAGGLMEAFKRRYRGADVLLVDDVQFLASKLRTEEELFHTFNALYDAGAQLVITSDRRPHDLDALEDRLRARFGSGLVADIGLPDRSTRLAVLRKRARLDGVGDADPAALDVIAERAAPGIRGLEAALIRVVAEHSIRGRPIDAPLATEVLSEHASSVKQSAPPTLADILEAVCREYDVIPDDLRSLSRAARVTWPRQVTMYLARQLTELSLQDVGRPFGGRNHATVSHACERVEQRRAADPAAGTRIDALVQRLTLGQ